MATTNTRYVDPNSTTGGDGTTNALTGAARAYVPQAARAVDGQAPDALLPLRQVKAIASEAALQVTAKAMRVCGGAAFAKHLPVERFFRDAQAGAIMAPTNDMLKEFIGKALLGIDLF